MIRAPRGFSFAAVTAGIRKTGGADLALILSDRPAAAAALFTMNRAAAAPVTLSRANLRATRGVARAILANAGNANCATPGAARVSAETARSAAALLGIDRRQVLVASTGVIGVPLNPRLILDALPAAVERLSPDRFGEAASAILTTDTRPKVAFREISGRAGRIRVLGMAKGAGMIHPQMATMLAFVLTDARITAPRLGKITGASAERTFNRISVDGDTSTNDTLFVLANGAAGPAPEGRLAVALEQVMGELARAIAADGEGARKLVRIEVSGARSETDAGRVARAIANSPLVKTAIAGGDPNWGRILSAAGASGADLEPSRVRIRLNRIAVCRNGVAAPFDEGALSAALAAAAEVLVQVDLGMGRGRAAFWTCDLTEEYIRINASYRT